MEKQSVRQAHHEKMKKESADDEKEWSDKMVDTELENHIHQIVTNLPAKCRQLFRMNRQEGLSNKEISEELNMFLRTVETHISNALKVLWGKLEDYI